MTVTYADEPPAGTKALDLRSTAGAQRAPLDALSTNVVYACIAVNMLVTIDSGPQFTFVLPNSFADPAINYYVAIRQNANWVDGYGGPGLVSAAGGSSDVSIDGRFGFAIPPNGQVCVALYGRYKTSSTPVPATAPSPTATATPEPPIASVASLAFTSLGAQSAQTFSVKEARYTGTWTETDTCAAFATVATTDHTNFTVTPNAVGSCAITITDSFKTSTKVPVDVTSTTFGVQ
jgi:hypothetical protein